MNNFEELFRLKLSELPRLPLTPVGIAVIDSGIDAALPQLRGRVANGQSNNDCCGHGTAVAGILAGLAPNAVIHDIKVLDEHGFGSGEALIEGFSRAIDSEAKLINMSLNCRRKYRTELMALCDLAYRKDKIVIGAKCNLPLADDLGFPAELATCIGVEPDAENNPFRVRYTGFPAIEFSAQGELIKVLRPGGGYRYQSGSSLAVPVVGGLLALLLGYAPDLKLFELKTLLKHYGEQQKCL